MKQSSNLMKRSCYLAILIFLLISIGLFTQQLSNLDQLISQRLFLKQNLIITSIMRFITLMGNAPIALLVYGFVTLHFLKKAGYVQILIITFTLFGSYAINTFLKILFKRTRPSFPHLVQASGYSFPSGHAMVSLAFYGLLCYFLWRVNKQRPYQTFIKPLIWLFMILILLIGLSRIYLLVHYTSDVIAGYAGGFIWLYFCLKVEKLREEQK